MITETENQGYFNVDVIVKEIVFGNTYNEFESTSFKVICDDCIIMVFKENFELFRNVSAGSRFQATVKKWKDKTYKFRKMSY